jgi:hypothetical protein
VTSFRALKTLSKVFKSPRANLWQHGHGDNKMDARLQSGFEQGPIRIVFQTPFGYMLKRKFNKPEADRLVNLKSGIQIQKRNAL